jgi:hypothetical protein
MSKIMLKCCIGLVIVFCIPAVVTHGQSPCIKHPIHSGWKFYINVRYRFCFEYPPNYQMVSADRLPHSYPGSGISFLAEMQDHEFESSPHGVEYDEPRASIDIELYPGPPDPDLLRKWAPTGLEDVPPKLVRAAHQTFYFYGAGGGGVSYSDDFYFGLRGRTFLISFFGPYLNDKSPTPVITAIEPVILKSFRSF